MEEKTRVEQHVADILKFVAPGTPIREGIDNVLRANTGGLIVLGYNDQVKAIVDGGFKINCSFSPSYLYELAKMDGAIILNDTGTEIILANAQLIPDAFIPSSETGMRHRTAERVAKQTKAIVMAISQRRNVITLYQGEFRYSLKDISVILTKANQGIQTLEKYKVVLDQSISNLSLLEFEEFVTYNDLLKVLHRFEMVLRIKHEICSYLNELGVEGRLIRLQMNELLTDIEEEAIYIFRDYAAHQNVNPYETLDQLQRKVSKEVLDDAILLKLLGYQGYVALDQFVCTRGYRILSKIPRLPLMIIDNLVAKFQHLGEISKATIQELDEVDGIGEVRARKIKEGLKLFKEQTYAERQL
ncbi:DNA integrity scanning protein DisA [Bacillus coahuilensis p1.1.43]|uniref:DNA integrity scanning protein DisA n=1 Tax=Bacillus coahuilensis p1.1.43 TaxID=1150625 RepID=A0A147K5G1_9BACI|nr:DNA integrity scanning diadenylate cyclase DisA [Bacillus coahuilensis]KUP04814.1 DNA integrity scanning protein DisA [Bacillus coahuilensis p1.1.43]